MINRYFAILGLIAAAIAVSPARAAVVNGTAAKVPDRPGGEVTAVTGIYIARERVDTAAFPAADSIFAFLVHVAVAARGLLPGEWAVVEGKDGLA